MPAAAAHTLGLDFGTNSVRALVVRAADGAGVAAAVAEYPGGDRGVILDPREPELARQHPADHLAAMTAAVREALAGARETAPGFLPAAIAGIGVDTTGSTPLPLDTQGQALALRPEFAQNPHALAWLWKDHTATAEAAALTAAALAARPEHLAKCGGAYSSEWFWAKVWRCAQVAPEVAAAAATWIELADWIPAVLCGTTARPVRGVCAAGHKAMHHPAWGGYPETPFLEHLHPELGRIRRSLDGVVVTTVDRPAGRLGGDWAQRLGLPAGIPVAVGALDAHLGAVGAGVAPGTLVKILGTSTCDITVAPPGEALPDIPGISGIVPGSVLPGHVGLEAGQSAVGDLFNWLVEVVRPGGLGHDELAREAQALPAGAGGLLALDWNHGNRNLLADQRLTGLLVGQTLRTRPAEIYRALIEATAFGARMIIERIEAYGVPVARIVGCGGIAGKSPLLMQIYADVLNRPMEQAGSAQTCALGAAMAGAVAAGIHPDFAAARRAMVPAPARVFEPAAGAAAVYDRLFRLYRDLHDAFGAPEGGGRLGHVMKELIALRTAARRAS